LKQRFPQMIAKSQNEKEILKKSLQGGNFLTLSMFFVNFTLINYMGNLKKKRRLKMNKHKRRKRLKSNRHKKRTW